jgi:hypothetical protein
MTHTARILCNGLLSCILLVIKIKTFLVVNAHAKAFKAGISILMHQKATE